MSIWDNLNTRTLFGSAKATGTQVNTQEKDIHLEEKNRQLLNDINLINKSLMRADGGIIPGSGEVKTYTQTNDSDYQFIIPPDGEMWMIQGISSTVDASGANTAYLYLTSPGLTATADMVYLSSLASSSANVPIFPSDAEYKANFLELTSNMYLRVHSNMDNVTTGSTTFKVGYVLNR